MASIDGGEFSEDIIEALEEAGVGGTTLPDNATGYLQNDGSGDLTWATPSGGGLPPDANGYLKNTGGAVSWEEAVPPTEINIDTILIPNGTPGAFVLKADGGATYMTINSNGDVPLFTQGISANDITALDIKTLDANVNLTLGHGTGTASIVANDPIVGPAISGTGLEARTHGVTILDAGTTGPTLKAASGAVNHDLLLPVDNAIGVLQNDGVGNLTWDPSAGGGTDLDLTSITLVTNTNNALEIKNATFGNVIAIDTTDGDISTTINDKLVVGGQIVCLDQITALSTTQSNGFGTGSLLTHGGCGIAKNLNVGGSVGITGSLTAPTATFTNLTVTGNTTTANEVKISDPIIEVGVGNTSNTTDIGMVSTYSNDGGTTQLYGGMLQVGTGGSNAIHFFKDSVTIPGDVSNSTHAPVFMSDLVLTGQDKFSSTVIAGHPLASYGLTLPQTPVDNTVLRYVSNGETSWDIETVSNQAVSVAGSGTGIPGAWTVATSPNELVNIKVSIWDSHYNKFFCAVPSPTNFGVWESSDGKTYTSLATPIAGTGSHQIASSGDGRLMIARGSAMLYSTNGSTYAATATSPPTTIRGIAYGNGIWMAGGENAVYSSTNNGATWVQKKAFSGIITLAEFAQYLNSGVGGFIIGFAASSSEKVEITDSNGNFVNVLNTTSPLFTFTDAVTGISVSESLQRIVIGTNNATSALYITDNKNDTYTATACTFSGGSPSSGVIYGGAYGSGKFIITTGGSDTEYYESSDGITLTKKTDMKTTVETYVAYSPTLDLFAVAHSGGSATNQMLWREENGTATVDVDMGVNATDYYTFNSNTDNKIYNDTTSLMYIETDTGVQFKHGESFPLLVDDVSALFHVPINYASMTTAERDALAPSAGMAIWNYETGHLNIYDGNNWTVNNSYSEAGSWEDMVQYLGAGDKKASNPPTEEQDADDFTVLMFDVGDVVTLKFHVLHDYKLGSGAYVHVHWYPKTTMAVGETVVWNITWKIAKGHGQGESLLGGTTSFDITHVADGTEIAGEHIITECSDLQAFDMIEPDAMLMVRIERAASTFGGDVIGVSCDLHYQSTQETTVNKTPPFW